ncbi:MAG: lipase family protein [Pseudomonadota bacterium]
MNKLISMLAVALLGSLAACGGGSNSPTTGAGSNGTLLSQSTVATVSVAELNIKATSTGLIALSGLAKCDVTLTAIDYQTSGVQPGEVTNATAAVLLPSGPNCPKEPAPLLAYARGSEVSKAYVLAKVDNPETYLLMSLYAAQGYVVVATDYLGYAGSRYPYHPYLHADSEASSVIDSIRAARRVAGDVGVALSGKVMLTGYSQGGHASMAAHRAIERDIPGEINVVAGGHMAGPYNLAQAIVEGATVPVAAGQFFAPFFITAWQKIYGDLYRNTSEVFRAPYAADIENIFPGAFDYTTMLEAGKVPADLNYLPTLFQPAYLADLQANQSSPTLRAARRNDLLGWNPKSSMALCGGAQDPTVGFALHAEAAQADFASRGIAVPVIDVDPIIRGLAAAANQPVDLEQYHAVTAPPLCMAALREQLFDPAR